MEKNEQQMLQIALKGIADLQAQVTVLSCCLHALLPAIDESKRIAVACTLKKSLNDLLSLEDEFPKAAPHQHAALALANGLLRALESQRPTSGEAGGDA